MDTDNYYFFLPSPIPDSVLWNKEFSNFLNDKIKLLKTNQLSLGETDKVIYTMSELDKLFDFESTPSLKVFCMTINPYKRMVLFYLTDINKYVNCNTFDEYLIRYFSQPHSDNRNKLNLVDLFTDKVKPNYFIEFDNMESDLKLIPELSDAEMIPGIAHLKDFANNYRNYYNKDTQKLVGDVFKKDIDYFGYKF